MPTSVGFWFPAKPYGWGWGPPVTWQGWVVMAVYFTAMLSAAMWVRPRYPIGFLGAMLAASGAFILIIYTKGEPPKGRWRE